MGYLSWIGNLFIVIGLWRIGYKDRNAFLFSIIGETLWIAWSVLTHNWSLAFICTVFNVLALRNYLKWGKA